MIYLIIVLPFAALPIIWATLLHPVFIILITKQETLARILPFSKTALIALCVFIILYQMKLIYEAAKSRGYSTSWMWAGIHPISGSFAYYILKDGHSQDKTNMNRDNIISYTSVFFHIKILAETIVSFIVSALGFTILVYSILSFLGLFKGVNIFPSIAPNVFLVGPGGYIDWEATRKAKDTSLLWFVLLGCAIIVFILGGFSLLMAENGISFVNIYSKLRNKELINMPKFKFFNKWPGYLFIFIAFCLFTIWCKFSSSNMPEESRFFLACGFLFLLTGIPVIFFERQKHK